MKTKLLGPLIAVLAVAAALALAPNANADSEEVETPHGLQANSTANGVSLNWRMIQADTIYADDNIGYNVYRDDEYLWSTQASSYDDPVSSDAAHSYYVVAYIRNPNTGAIAFSSKSQAVTADTSFGPPTSVSISPRISYQTGLQYADRVLFYWTNSTGTESVNIYRNGEWIANVKGTQWEDTDALGWQDNTYTLVAKNSAGTRASTGPRSVSG